MKCPLFPHFTDDETGSKRLSNLTRSPHSSYREQPWVASRSHKLRHHRLSPAYSRPTATTALEDWATEMRRASSTDLGPDLVMSTQGHAGGEDPGTKFPKYSPFPGKEQGQQGVGEVLK